MPLRDHFPPPFDRYGWWQGLYGGWPAVIVQHLRDALPPGYRAGPIVRIATDPPLHEVRLYDVQQGRRLVAAIELVSPLNKDSPARRRAFVHRCADLLECDVAVSVVDVVTAYPFDLFAELMVPSARSLPRILVARPGRGPAAAYAAAVAGGVARRAARPGGGLRAGLPRPVDRVSEWETEGEPSRPQAAYCAAVHNFQRTITPDERQRERASGPPGQSGAGVALLPLLDRHRRST
jgi:hypothetical protein